MRARKFELQVVLRWRRCLRMNEPNLIRVDMEKTHMCSSPPMRASSLLRIDKSVAMLRDVCDQTRTTKKMEAQD